MNSRKSGQIFIPPEEQISLQLMRDPVIVASGQTYERVCVEKWFCDGKLLPQYSEAAPTSFPDSQLLCYKSDCELVSAEWDHCIIFCPKYF
jgi:hypothetical protein